MNGTGRVAMIMDMAGLDCGEAFVLADLEGCSFSLVWDSTLSCSSCPARSPS